MMEYINALSQMTTEELTRELEKEEGRSRRYLMASAYENCLIDKAYMLQRRVNSIRKELASR